MPIKIHFHWTCPEEQIALCSPKQLKPTCQFTQMEGPTEKKMWVNPEIKTSSDPSRSLHSSYINKNLGFPFFKLKTYQNQTLLLFKTATKPPNKAQSLSRDSPSSIMLTGTLSTSFLVFISCFISCFFFSSVRVTLM